MASASASSWPPSPFCFCSPPSSFFNLDGSAPVLPFGVVVVVVVVVVDMGSRGCAMTPTGRGISCFITFRRVWVSSVSSR